MKAKMLGIMALAMFLIGGVTAVNYDYTTSPAITHTSPENDTQVILEEPNDTFDVEVTVNYSYGELVNATETEITIEDTSGHTYTVTSETYTAGTYTGDKTYLTNVTRDTLANSNIDFDEELSLYSNVSNSTGTLQAQETVFNIYESGAFAVLYAVIPLLLVFVAFESVM